jgi:hypothetical protein
MNRAPIRMHVICIIVHAYAVLDFVKNIVLVLPIVDIVSQDVNVKEVFVEQIYVLVLLLIENVILTCVDIVVSLSIQLL